MVAGALAGVALDALAARSIALVGAFAVVAIAFAGHYRFGYRRFLRALESIEPIFPTEKATEPGRS